MENTNKITYFAETDARNKNIKFGIKASDRLRHTYVIGKTGVGKSVLLENLAIQDIQNGEGLAFIDPHGSTAEKLLDYVPENRIKDVLYFAPFDMEYPITFNVLEDIGVDKRHLVVNGLMSTFEKIWVDAWSARMAYILNNTLLALLEYPGATLLGLNRMLSDKDYRRKVVDNIKDPSVKAFWVDEFGKYTDKYAQEATPAIQNKVGQFTSNPLIRNLVGQSKSSFDIRDFMDNKKILIINLSKGLVGEGNANLLGSMMITKIYLAAMSRADKNKEELAKLAPFYLYVDEFQSFANKSFADILSEARKYKLSLNIAHQYIEQMEEEVRDAVFGNAGTMITFRVGAFDAEVLEKEFAPYFTAEDLVNLGKYQIYLKLMIDDVSSQPFSARTLPPITKPDISFKTDVIKSSREQFARPRAEVESEIIIWHDEGTKREVKPVSPHDDMPKKTQYPPKDFSGGPRYGENNIDKKISDTPETSVRQPETVKIDPNKEAFMKASQMLREREEARKAPQTIPLSSLANNRDGKKNPTKENISSLKEALAQVIKKTEGPKREHKPAPNPYREAPIPTGKQIPEPVKKDDKIEPKPEPVRSAQQASNTSEVKKEPKHEEAKREVPEDVLRKLLDMNET